MSQSGAWFIAAKEGTSFTMYAVMERLGIPLSPRQEACQRELERRYPPVIEHEEEEDGQT